MRIKKKKSNNWSEEGNNSKRTQIINNEIIHEFKIFYK